MLSGSLYDPNAPSLIDGRAYAKHHCRLLNDTDGNPTSLPRDAVKSQRNTILHGLLGDFTDGRCYIEPPFWCDYGRNISIGPGFYANHGTVILDCNRVTIGRDVMFGPNVQVYTAGHPVDVAERRRGDEFARAISIGDDVWVGGNVVLLPGVTIGDGVTIAAGAVVNKSVPPNCVVAGSPCRIVKKLEGFVEPSAEMVKAGDIMKEELRK